MHSQTTSRRLSPLQNIYFSDGLSALSMGAILSLFAEELTRLAAWTLPSGFLLGVGLFLLPWSVFNFWSAGRKPLSGKLAAVHFLVDGSWLVGTLALLLIHSHMLSRSGALLLCGQGLFVAFVLLSKSRNFCQSALRPIF